MDLFVKPNWSGGVKEDFEFLTTVFTTRSGKEQRSAERKHARRSLSFQALLHGDRLDQFRDYLHGRRHYKAFFPEPVEDVGIVSSYAPVGATTLHLTMAPDLPLEDYRICIASSKGVTFTTVGGVSGSTLSLDEPLQVAVMAGDEVRRCLSGRMPTNVALSYQTDTIATLSATINQEPGSSNRDYGTDPFEIFRGREVFNEQPNWANSPTVEFTSDYESTDFRRGVIKTFSPSDFFAKITQFTFLGRSTRKMYRLIDFFHRQLGRCEEFWCPSWTSDLKLASAVANGDDSITVTGSNVSASYSTSSVEKAIAIELSDGTWLYKYVTEMEASGENTVITFDEPFALGVEQRDVRGLYWLNVCRFAADTMSVQWITNEIAQTVLQIKALEALPAEV